jgi:hypothetical protein
MLYAILILAALGLLVPVLRTIGIVLLVIIGLGIFYHSDGAQSSTLSLQQLQEYKLDCKKKDDQLVELERIERNKDYSNIDAVLGDNYQYMDLLKTKIWYLRRECK